MTTLHLEIPDEVRTRLAARAQQGGYADVKEFVEALLWAEAEGAEVPAQLVAGDEADLVNKLRQGAASPVKELMAADWQEKRRRLASQRGGRP